jgi:hypothetical protein
MLIAIGAASCATVACGSSKEASGPCEDVCAWSNACPGAQQTNCSRYCATTSSINTASGCEDTYAEYLSCKAQHKSDLCLPADESCVPSLAVYFQCVQSYCNMSPTPSGCS